MKLESYGKHQSVMQELIKYINKKQPGQFVAKGGIALTMCYGVDRATNDMDFDGRNCNIVPIVKEFCRLNGYQFAVKKDTDTTKRCMVNYGEERTPLKVEVSYRRHDIPDNIIKDVKGITTYSLDELAVAKAVVYLSRDRINDVYDLATICTQHFDELSQTARSVAREAVMTRGLEHYEYIAENQMQDTLLKEDVLLERFLQMYENLDLVRTEQEKELTTKMRNNCKARQSNQKPLFGKKDPKNHELLKSGRKINRRSKQAKGLPWMRRGIK